MFRVVARTLLLLFAVICAVIPGARADAQLSSGIEGQALIGPTCPVARAGDPNCADRPYRVALTVKTPDGLEVAHFSTDAQGRFRVVLEPGRYVIKAVSARRMRVVPELPDDLVTVSAGRFTALKLVFDSGRR